MNGDGPDGERGGVRDLGRWVALDGRGRAPLVLALMFWGVFLLDAGAIAFYAAFVPPPPPDPVADLLGLGHLAALPVAALCWPFLYWAPQPLPRRAAVLSVVFFTAVHLLMLTSGGSLVFVMSSIAIGNVVLVLGTRAAVACTLLAVLTPVPLFALTGGPVLRGVFEAGIILFLGVMMILVFSGLLSARRQAERTRSLLAELEEAHAELRRYAERTRELTVAEERARMAREMHDSVGHYLTVINMGLANAERFRRARPEAAWDEVRDARLLTQEALADTRRWVRALRPLRLEGRAGPDAMRALAAAFSGSKDDPAVSFTQEGEWPDPGEEAELVCYRIVQEGLTNAARHAAAARIGVRLACTGERIELTVADDGVGGDPERTGSGGFGLRGLRERVQAAGGTLEAGDGAGGGFELRAVLPVRPGAAGPRGASARTEAAR
ncbi:sensor histidine kinase [Nocardiopsis potens]|uniref:sensor histidine kinase n=1 Tax=Nocardiopsis potens TaxID=1246458 RepID=UPI00035C9000|nr:sensor histidine kinase [Nocardiopsis potens]